MSALKCSNTHAYVIDLLKNRQEFGSIILRQKIKIINIW